MMWIEYRKGYKQQLTADYLVEIPIRPSADIRTDFIILTVNGQLLIKQGYAWDGPSRPAIPTKNSQRGALVHDALYQLMRMRLLRKSARGEVDKILRSMLLEDDMSRIRAWWWYRGLKAGGGPAADPKNRKPVIKAP